MPGSEDRLSERLAGLLGEVPRPVPEGYRVDGLRPRWEVEPADEEQACAVLALAAEEGLAVVPRGSGSRDRLGTPLARADLVLSTRRLRGVVEHEPADLTVTVRAGTTLEELGQALAAHRQRLPLDPPEGGTVGGVVASAASGPRQLAFGGPRDMILGLRAALSHGHAIKAGGRVVKNVAGYDLCKLFTGSMGCLGVLTEATFKVRPFAEATATVALGFEGTAAAGRCAAAVLASELLPAALEVANPAFAAELGLPRAWALLAALEETRPGIEYQVARLAELGEAGGAADHRLLAGEEQEALWRRWRQWGAHREAPLALRCAVAPAAGLPLVARVEEAVAALPEPPGLLASAGAGTGVVRLTVTPPAPGRGDGNTELLAVAELVSAETSRAGGHAVLTQAPASIKERLPVWGHEGDAGPLMRALKDRFDPSETLCPGRLIAEATAGVAP